MTFYDVKDIQIQPFSTSSSRTTFLLHYKEVFLEVGADVVDLVKCMQRYSSEEEAIAAYVKAMGETYSSQIVMNFWMQLKEKLDPIVDGKTKQKKVFFFQKELISADRIARYTSWFSFLFRKEVMGILAICFIVCEVYFFSNVLFTLQVPHIGLYTLGALLLFFIFSSLIHEMGHAAACRYYNVQHGGIGFGLYVNIPVFYTDVSRIWKLSRGQRCVVNLAGIYFQAILLLPFLIAYSFTYSDLVKYVVFVANLNFFVTLNPFFKFDGYWLMTDLLGIPNLRKRSNECITYYWKKLRGKVTGKQPYLLSLPRRIKFVFTVYTVVVNLFFAYYFFYVIPVFLIRFCRTFPDKFEQLLTELLNQQLPDWANLQQLAVQLLFLGLTVYMVYRIVFSLFHRRKELL